MSRCVVCFAIARRNLASSFLPITSLQAQPFHAITHSLAQRRHVIPPILNSFRALLPLTAISFFATHFHAFARFLSSIQPQLSSFQSLAASCASPKKSSPLESNKSGLFLQNTRGGGGSSALSRDASSTFNCRLSTRRGFRSFQDLQMRRLHPECIYGTFRYSDLQDFRPFQNVPTFRPISMFTKRDNMYMR